ncbi:MAG: hypothetical protein M1401_16655 [Chloroflexi bacterium]|nr:hypothetical protein [Chloroflexota bacterium]
MGGVFTVLKWGARDWYDEMVMFTGVGVIATIASLPFLAVLFALFAALQLPLLFILAFAPFIPSPALVGMYGLARELAKGEGISWALFKQVTSQYWKKSLLLYVISLAGTALIITSMLFYLSIDNQILQFLGYAWLYGVLIWLMMQMYLLPLLLEQERGSIFRIYRNALIIAVAKPLVTLGVFIVSILLLIAGAFTVIGLPLVVLPLMASLGAHALRYSVYGPPVILR